MDEMNTRLLPESATPLRKALWVTALTCVLAQSVLLAAPLFGWEVSILSLLRRLPLSIEVFAVFVCAGLSATLLTELLHMCSHARWDRQRYFRITVLLWMLCTAIQGGMLLVQ